MMPCANNSPFPLHFFPARRTPLPLKKGNGGDHLQFGTGRPQEWTCALYTYIPVENNSKLRKKSELCLPSNRFNIRGVRKAGKFFLLRKDCPRYLGRLEREGGRIISFPSPPCCLRLTDKVCERDN